MAAPIKSKQYSLFTQFASLARVEAEVKEEVDLSQEEGFEQPASSPAGSSPMVTETSCKSASDLASDSSMISIKAVQAS